MKKYLIIFVLLISTGVIANQTDEKVEITFEELEHDFGTIEQGSKAETEFVFKNTGKEPLVLSNVKTSCGCTVPDWPKEPIQPGDSASIKVTYNTNKIGVFNKSITVFSNAETNGTVVLHIKGEVKAK